MLTRWRLRYRKWRKCVQTRAVSVRSLNVIVCFSFKTSTAYFVSFGTIRLSSKLSCLHVEFEMSVKRNISKIRGKCHEESLGNLLPLTLSSKFMAISVG